MKSHLRQQAARRRSRARATTRPFCATRLVARPEIADAFLERGAELRPRSRLLPRRTTSRRDCAGSATALRWRSRSAILPASCRSSASPACCPISPTRRSTRRSPPQSASACPMPSRRASPSSPWASSAATSSTIHPTSTCCCCSIRKRCRAASATMPARRRCAIGAANHRDPAEADRGRLRPAGRPAASAVARSHADRAAGQRRDLALRIERAAVGAGGFHPGACGGRRYRARAAVPRRRSSRSSGGARSISE